MQLMGFEPTTSFSNLLVQVEEVPFVLELIGGIVICELRSFRVIWVTPPCSS